MKQVDFYLIANRVDNARFKLASRLANKLNRLNKKVLILLGDAEQAEQLNEIMWAYSDTSFVPHEVLNTQANTTNESSTPASNIHIADQTQLNIQYLSNQYDVLINLNKETSLFSHHFERIADIVEADDTEKAIGRERYKTYREEGFELQMHNIEL